MRSAYTLNGMHGLGDNLHERAIVRELMRGHDLWLKTSWPQLFWDLPELHLLPLKSPIPWMAKNEIRTAALYGHGGPPGFEGGEQRLSQPDASRQSRLGSADHGRRVRRAAWGGRFSPADSARWRAKAEAVLTDVRPLMIYRPLDRDLGSEPGIGSRETRAQPGLRGVPRAFLGDPRSVFRCQHRRHDAVSEPDRAAD